jgi:hypothetical protein
MRAHVDSNTAGQVLRRVSELNMVNPGRDPLGGRDGVRCSGTGQPRVLLPDGSNHGPAASREPAWP